MHSRKPDLKIAVRKAENPVCPKGPQMVQELTPETAGSGEGRLKDVDELLSHLRNRQTLRSPPPTPYFQAITCLPQV